MKLPDAPSSTARGTPAAARHHGVRTEDAYHDRARRFIPSHGKRHPAEMGAAGTTAFPTHPAAEGRVPAGTQNRASGARPFPYTAVFEADPGTIAGVVRADRPRRRPVVPARPEVVRVPGRRADPYRLRAELMYGGGRRPPEVLRLRVKDVDFGRREVAVRGGKGDEDRRTVPAAAPRRTARAAEARRAPGRDWEAGRGRVSLPDALGRKLPGADREFIRRYVFPSDKLSTTRGPGRPAGTTCTSRRRPGR